jgi:pyruvate dehydrogenase E1 component alpha subunit
MTTIKQCDDKMRNLLMSGQLMLIWYSPRGQEVVAAATGLCLQPDDYMVTTYRGLHDQIAKGMSLRELWAEWLGKATGACKGKGGPMHVTDPSSGLMVTTGIVGGGLPIATGLGLSSQIKGDGRVTVCSFGDGATNIGGFHEALNLASLWKLPVVFLCQNNGYAEHTTFAKGTSSETIAARAAAYGMRGVTVDGNDPLAMLAAAREAVDRARAGEGPTLLEARTYRFMGHFFGDAGAYMDKEEYAAAVAADPVPAFRAWLVDQGMASEEDLATLEKRIDEALEEAYAAAVASPDPDLSELQLDVYAPGVNA